MSSWIRPSGTLPFRIPLIGSAFARRGQPARASPVPCRAVATCSPPYPGGVLHRSGSTRCSLLPSPRRDRLGHPSLSGAYLSGLQGSLQAGPVALLPARRPYSRRRAFDAPLGRRDLARRLEPATWLSGDYQGGTYTRKFDTACQRAFRRPPPGDPGIVRVRTHHGPILTRASYTPGVAGHKLLAAPTPTHAPSHAHAPQRHGHDRQRARILG